LSYSFDRFNNLIESTVAEIQKLASVKGGEYTAGKEDRLDNFRRQAIELEVPMELIWKVYAQKHWDALSTYVNDIVHGRDRPRSEPITGRADDIIVYLILFKAICDEREEYANDQAAWERGG